MTTDENSEVIRKRLLIEGDGGGDDKRISTLLKSFARWSTSNESKEESERSYEKLQSQLAAVEFNFAKAHLVYGMNVKENENYEELYAKIDDDLKNAVVKIEESKKELEKAKVIRKNRQEYHALAKIINEHPDRQATIDRIAALEKEHSVLKNTKAQLERKLEQRRRQFHLLVTSIHQLQALLEEDDNEDTIDEPIEAEEPEPEPTTTPTPTPTAMTPIPLMTLMKTESDDTSSMQAEDGDVDSAGRSEKEGDADSAGRSETLKRESNRDSTAGEAMETGGYHL